MTFRSLRTTSSVALSALCLLLAGCGSGPGGGAATTPSVTPKGGGVLAPCGAAAAGVGPQLLIPGPGTTGIATTINLIEVSGAANVTSLVVNSAAGNAVVGPLQVNTQGSYDATLTGLVPHTTYAVTVQTTSALCGSVTSPLGQFTTGT